MVRHLEASNRMPPKSPDRGRSRPGRGGKIWFVTAEGAEDARAARGDRFVDDHYGSLRGRIRVHVIHKHLQAHLDPPPLRIVDVGGGAGHQSIPLAREGYDVTIVDPSPS
jgi:hypothetical protein